MRFTFDELATLAGATILRRPRNDLAMLLPVSQYRRLAPDTCYFPIRRLTDAAAERQRLKEKQPAAVMLSRDGPGLPLHDVPDAGVMMHASPWQAYFQVAAAARARGRALVIGITGSAGKSSVTEFVATALSGRYRVHSSQGNRNACLDSCDLLLDMAGTADEAVVIEMGFDRYGDVARMSKTARPHLGIITNVSEAHLEGADDAWAVLVREKGRLAQHLEEGGCLLINADDPGCRLLPLASYACEVKTFGFAPEADARLTSVTATETGLRLSLACCGRRLDLALRVFGEWQAVNVAAAVLAAQLAGVPLAEVKDALEAKPPPSHRFHVYRFEQGLTVIDDTFNATVASVEQGLYAAARLAGRRRKIAWLSGVKWLGRQSRALHERLGRTAARLGYDQAVLIRRRYNDGLQDGLLAGGLAPERILVLTDYDAAPAALLPMLGPDTLLYCKAENAGPEVNVILQQLQQSGRRMR